MQLAAGLLKMLSGIGILLMVFAVFPATTSTGVRFERAPDLSTINLEIGVSRPGLMMWGVALLGIGLIAGGALTLMSLMSR
jgi:hypothetical protein